jgi:hypothetical protein
VTMDNPQPSPKGVRVLYVRTSMDAVKRLDVGGEDNTLMLPSLRYSPRPSETLGAQRAN